MNLPRPRHWAHGAQALLQVHDPHLVSDGLWQGLADAGVAVWVLEHPSFPARERFEV